MGAVLLAAALPEDVRPPGAVRPRVLARAPDVRVERLEGKCYMMLYINTPPLLTIPPPRRGVIHEEIDPT